MATETVASSTQIPATIDDEQVEKKISAEEKASDSVSLPKGSEDETPKTEDSASLATEADPEGVVDYKKIEPPAVEAEKAGHAPVLDVPLGVETKVENELIPDSQTLDTPKQVADNVESPAELPSLIESVVREAPKEPAADISEIGQVEQPKIVDSPLSSFEATEKPEEPLEVTSEKGSIASSVPLVDEPKVENVPVPDSQTPDIPKRLTDAVESPAEVQTNIESVVREAPIEIGQVEEPKIVDAPQSSVEAIEKPEEPLEVTSDKGSVETVLKEIKDSEPESFEVQKPELVIAEVEEKPGDQSEFTQQVEKKHDEVPEEPVQDETVIDEGSVADKVEPTTILEETETDDTPSLAVKEEPEQPKLTEQEKKHGEVGPEKNVEDDRVKDEGYSVDKVEESTLPEEGTTDNDDKPSLITSPEEPSLSREAPIGDSSLPGVTEKITADVQEKDLSGVDVVETLAEESPVETKKLREENVKTEENEKRNVIPEDSIQPIEEDQKKELSGVDVIEKLVEKAAVEPQKVGEKKVETEEDGKRNLITEDSVQPIIEDQRKELGGVDVIEKLAEETPVKLEKVGEENVAKSVETEDNEKKDVITEDSTPPIQEEHKKESGGVDVVEKLAEEAAVKLEKVGEEKVAKNNGIEENEERNVITEDSTQPIEVDQKKELSAVDVVEKLAEEKVEIEKSGEENETRDVKFDDKENRNVINEVSTQTLGEDVNSSIYPTEVTEKSFEGVEKHVEPVAKSERAEHIKDETPAIVETKKDESVEEKQDEVTRAVNEPLTDSNQSESEVKGEETIGTDADKLEKAVGDAAKSDQNVEPPTTKDGDDTDKKPSQDLPKEVPAKPSQKQSNTILSKVKQSLVKAKKVITGKSPSSKTPASGTKDEIKVK